MNAKPYLPPKSIRNGTPSAEPRKIGAIPYRSDSDKNYTLEHWQFPGIGSRWLVRRRDGYLCKPTGPGDALLIAESSLAYPCVSPDVAKVFIAEWESVADREPATSRPWTGSSPSTVLNLIVLGDRYSIEEWPGGWYARCGDGYLAVPWAWVPREQARAFATAAEAQDEAIAFAERPARLRAAAEVRAMAERVERGELAATVSRSAAGRIEVVLRETAAKAV